MQNSSPQKISSATAILNSIEFDPQTRRWFTLLILQPGVQARLQKNQAGQQALQEIHRALRSKRTVLSLFVVILSLAFIQMSWILLAAGMIFLLGLLHPLKSLTKNLRQISKTLLLEDFGEELLTQHTLYQVGEIYHRRYAVISLVEMISRSDRLLVYLIVAPIIFCLLLPTVSMGKFILTLLFVYAIFESLINLDLPLLRSPQPIP